MSKLRQADRRVEELMEELAAVRAEQNEAKMMYVLPKQKKLRTFSGNDGSSVESFVEDARAALKVRKLRGTEAVDFVLSHLDGPARQEVKHQPQAVQAKADRILQALLETFGERRTLGSLMREICSRVQGEDESIADFGFALMGLADKLSNIPGPLMLRRRSKSNSGTDSLMAYHEAK
ncbi:hypothetical protein HOLleu_10248 [Holothuria leucospilota]|uniref:Uncharacterized protein n=1 Tax=Holothuria leucospilota TaxID=206669 RepID=A0A9Q1HFK4_HOLLE|nr:hypothetical protein HOLleu_10248 [Holothuria leucospilota]